MMKKSNYNSRFLFIDLLRGVTIILMIFFHLNFDLSYFQMTKIDILHDKFWFLLPRIIVFLFLFTVGMSLKVAHNDKIHWQPFVRRLVKIIFFALIISVFTYAFFHENWIYFGTLHAIALISVLSLPFLRYPRLGLAIAIVLFTTSIILKIDIPWFSLPHQSWDYIEPFPWLGASLLGMFAAHVGMHQTPIHENKLTIALSNLGRRSLVVYLLHQPILFSLVAIVHQIIT